MIVYGVAADSLGAVIQHSLGPPGPHSGMPELRRRVAIFDSDGYELRQRRVRVDLDHDPARTVGRLAHLERSGNGQLWAVAEVRALPDAAADLFWSPLVRYREGGLAAERVRLEALALVRDPASVGLGPVRTLSLRLADPLPTGVACRLPPFDRELLRRAISAHREQRDDALEIVGHPGDLEPRAAEPGAPAPPVGPFRHGASGRVLSVR